MTNKVFSQQQIGDLLRPIFDEYHVNRAVLFGSYAKGCATETSDVDILVDSGLIGLSFFGLLEDVVTKLNKSVDLIDTSQVIPGSTVDSEIKKTGVVIYE